MKWGRKKPSSAAAAASSSSSHPSLISHVLPTSWLAKFKQITVNSGQKHRNMRQKGKEKPEPWSFPRCGHVGGGGKFSGGDGDAFWRLSFGDADDGVDVGKIAGLSRLSCFDSDEEPEFQPSNCQSCKRKAAKLRGKEDAHKFSSMVSHAREMRGLPREVELFPQTEPCIREKVAEIRTPRLRVEKEKKVRKRNQRILEEKEPEFHGEPYELEGTQRKAIAEKYYETESGGTDGITEREDCKLTAFDSSDSCVRKAAEGCAFPSLKESEEFSAENKSPEWQKLKEMKIEEVLSRSEKQRKSLYISRELSRRRPKHNSRIRVYSPRTASKVEICKIRALEDMKKAKLRMKKKAKEKAVEGLMGLESFAVVKCSFDPHKDFRESMIEMIQEKRISQPEELEELLACYLTLNSDQYHDLIIKVFRQVWFDLNPVCFDTELEDEHLYRDQPRFR